MSAVLALFWSFLKIGCVGYGGGPSMVPLIKEEVVNIQQWMSVTDFVDILYRECPSGPHSDKDVGGDRV